MEALSSDASLADEVFSDKAQAFHASYAGQVEYRRIVRERRNGRPG